MSKPAESKRLTKEQVDRIRAVCRTHDRFETESWKILALLDALQKISEIRDSIVGRQGFHFSDHAYPLVAALDQVGFAGAGYEIARKNVGTLVDLVGSLEAALSKALPLVENIHAGKGYTPHQCATADRGSSLGSWDEALKIMRAALANPALHE